MAEISQIGDGQIQGGMHTMTMTMTPLSQIGDGQIQNPVSTTTPTPTPAPTSVPATQVEVEPTPPTPNTDLPASSPPRPPIAPSKPPTVLEQACGYETRISTTLPTTAPTSTSTSISTSISPPSASAPGVSSATPDPANTSTPDPPTTRLSFVSCQTNSTLRLSLTNGTLLDARNRTGYIASNDQFQFDGPPQSGALITSGWSICAGSDGQSATLALRGNTTFWQCLSGAFYNLYTENWAAQCSPVELRVVSLVEC